MALRLVRETSETPNITNKDDTIMTRYAYGGYNGIVKGFGNECGYTAENGIFKVLSGEIILDGWEIQIDGAGWSLNLSNVSGTQYHAVYAEINVSTETVKLDSSYNPGSYPEIEKGDDLTQIPNGTARLLLYHILVRNGSIVNVDKKFNLIPYLAQKVLDLETDLSKNITSIEERLTKLGFKGGDIKDITIESGNKPVGVSLTRQGNYCLLEIEYKYYSFDSFKFQITKPEFFPLSSVYTGIGTVRNGNVYGGDLTITQDGTVKADIKSIFNDDIGGDRENVIFKVGYIGKPL